MSFKLSQQEKADEPILPTVSGISILSNLSQNWKVPSSIDTTPLGIFIEVNLTQDSKAEVFKNLRVLGNLTLVNLVQFEKAYSPIAITPSGIEIVFSRLNSSKEKPFIAL
jgi:hypothetical protein